MAQSYQAEIQRDPTGLYNQPIDLSGELGDKAHFVYDDVNKVYRDRAYSRDGHKYTYTYEIDPAKQTFGRKSAIYDTPEDAARHYGQAYQADPQHAMNIYQVRNADGTVRTIKLNTAEFNTDRQRLLGLHPRVLSVSRITKKPRRLSNSRGSARKSRKI